MVQVLVEGVGGGEETDETCQDCSDAGFAPSVEKEAQVDELVHGKEEVGLVRSDLELYGSPKGLRNTSGIKDIL